MASPNITGGVGSGAEALDRAQAEQAKAMQRVTAALNRKADREERSVRPTSVADFTKKDFEQGVFPGQEYSDIHAGLGGLRAGTPKDLQIQRRSEASAAVANADAAEIDEKENRATEDNIQAAKDMKVAFGAVTMAVTAFVAAVSSVQGKQEDASRTINNQRIRRGEAMRTLGYSTIEVSQRQKRAESGDPIPGNVTSEQEIQLLERAAQAKGLLLPNQEMRDQINAAIGSDASMMSKMGAMQSPFLANVDLKMRTIGQTRFERTAMAAKYYENKLVNDRTSSQAEASDAGAISREVENIVQMEQTKGSWKGYLSSVPGIEQAAKVLLKIDAKLRAPGPPSTTDGRSP